MSYIKEISGYNVKFKDEVSYLEARLEKLKSFDDIPFIGFLRHKMYDKSKCEVESIDPIPLGTEGYALDFTGTVSSNSNNFYYQISAPDNSWEVDYAGQWIAGEIALPMVEQTDIDKEEKKEPLPPDDPIENRFDILDL